MVEIRDANLCITGAPTMRHDRVRVQELCISFGMCVCDSCLSRRGVRVIMFSSIKRKAWAARGKIKALKSSVKMCCAEGKKGEILIVGEIEWKIDTGREQKMLSMHRLTG